MASQEAGGSDENGDFLLIVMFSVCLTSMLDEATYRTMLLEWGMYSLNTFCFL